MRTTTFPTRRAAMAGVALALAGCALLIPHWTVRYRITLEVDTPQGVKTGSSIWQATLSNNYAPGYAVHSEYKGEAVAVDLPTGTLFALLTNPDYSDYPAALAGTRASELGAAKGVDPQDWQTQWKLFGAQTAPYVLEAASPGSKRALGYPTLVRFRDIRDPKSVEAVDPGDLAKSFGPGVRLRRITIAVTDDSVTTGIEKRFGWWQSYRARHFDGTATVSEDLTTTALAAHLSSGSFSTEFNQ